MTTSKPFRVPEDQPTPVLRWGVDTCPHCYGVIGKECRNPAECSNLNKLLHEIMATTEIAAARPDEIPTEVCDGE